MATWEPPNGGSCEWYTKSEIFDALGMVFDLDPAHPGLDKLGHIPCKKIFTKADDGLSQPWEGRVWLNPPYGSETWKWVRKLADHGNGVCLVFTRTDAKAFHEIIKKASGIFFLSGRPGFLRADGQPAGKGGCGSMLIAFGEECADLLRTSDLDGTFFSVNEK